MAAPNFATTFGLVIFLFLPCCIYCEVDQTYKGCYFDTEGSIFSGIIFFFHQTTFFSSISSIPNHNNIFIKFFL